MPRSANLRLSNIDAVHDPTLSGQDRDVPARSATELEEPPPLDLTEDPGVRTVAGELGPFEATGVETWVVGRAVLSEMPPRIMIVAARVRPVDFRDVRTLRLSRSTPA